jgi:fatty-acyl-CoA synthase
MQNNHHVNHAMAQTILKRAELAPATTALTFEGQSQTFGALAERILRTATALRNAGVSRGDRVGFIGHNHPTFLEILYACSCIGAIFVPLNFRLTSPEVRFIANDAGVKIMFADAACRPLIDAERDSPRRVHKLAGKSWTLGLATQNHWVFVSI